MKAPIAQKHKQILSIHNDERIDNYFWLNDKNNPDVIHYLEEENKYSEFVMKDTEDLQNRLFEEMKARYKKDDESIPYFFNGYWYYVKYIEHYEYPIYCRKKKNLEEKEEILFDVNSLANGHEFYDFGSAAVSMDNTISSYSEDVLGRRIYTIRFKNLVSGEILEDKIENTTGKVVWANDNQHVFYIRKDKSLRAYKVFRHKIGTSPDEDVLVFHENDDTFDVGIYKTKSLEYIFIASSSSISDEHRFIPANDVFTEWKIIHPREEDLEYSVEHYDDSFYIITNANDSTNFKLVKTLVEKCNIEFWEDIISHRENVLLEGFEIFKKYLVIEERNEGLLQINIINLETDESHYLPFKEPTYTAYIGLNLEFDTSELHYGYTSLTHPNSSYQYNMETRETQLRKQQEVMEENFTSENYISERIWVSSRDKKVKIPISIVYHKNTRKSKNTPLLLYGYGSYGHTVDASFSNVRLSLLNRGFIYAIAHIRGGEYMGRNWYEDGKLLSKKNTFYDFIDCAKYLIDDNYTSSQHIYAMGGSAGGLLVGAVANMEPDLFKGIIAQVPFVDVVTTMLDETIPLTTGEYDEWGNPNELEYYNYIKSYSPYDNIEEKKYPNMLITTGLHDSQVQYWEPAKWVAKLRYFKTDENILIFKTDMTSGHGGASGRFESLKEDALEYSFLLKLENKIND